MLFRAAIPNRQTFSNLSDSKAVLLSAERPIIVDSISIANTSTIPIRFYLEEIGLLSDPIESAFILSNNLLEPNESYNPITLKSSGNRRLELFLRDGDSLRCYSNGFSEKFDCTINYTEIYDYANTYDFVKLDRKLFSNLSDSKVPIFTEGKHANINNVIVCNRSGRQMRMYFKIKSKTTDTFITRNLLLQANQSMNLLALKGENPDQIESILADTDSLACYSDGSSNKFDCTINYTTFPELENLEELTYAC